MKNLSTTRARTANQTLLKKKMRAGYSLVLDYVNDASPNGSRGLIEREDLREMKINLANYSWKDSRKIGPALGDGIGVFLTMLETRQTSRRWTRNQSGCRRYRYFLASYDMWSRDR